MTSYRSVALGAVLFLAACGKPDASGIYVYSTDREVVMVQLMQSADGKLTGRLQSDAINTDGTTAEKSASADGAVSGHDLLLKPSSIWYGGVQATGTFKGDTLTLAGTGFTLQATRATLEDYQQAVARLQSMAANQRQQWAKQKAADAAQQAEADAERAVAAKVQQVSRATSQMRTDTSRLSDALDRSPDFAQMATTNTAKVVRMVHAAPTLSSVARGQLSVAANQVEVGTNQIEVARSQYALGLNQLVDDVKDNALEAVRLCGEGHPSQLDGPCDTFKSAMTDFKAVFGRGKATFMPYKAQVQAEIDKQDEMIRQIDNIDR